MTDCDSMCCRRVWPCRPSGRGAAYLLCDAQRWRAHGLEGAAHPSMPGARFIVIVPGRGTLSAFTRLSPGFDAGIPADKSCWTAYSNGKQSSKRGKSFNALQLGYEKLLEIECAPERATRDLPGLGKVKRIRIQW